MCPPKISCNYCEKITHLSFQCNTKKNTMNQNKYISVKKEKYINYNKYPTKVQMRNNVKSTTYSNEYHKRISSNHIRGNKSILYDSSMYNGYRKVPNIYEDTNNASFKNY